MLLAGEKLPISFYVRPTLEVARDVLGKIFVRRLGKKIIAGRIVEVEAYHQDGDFASHSSHGKTKRNEVMFGIGGLLYVYFTYGMHYCMNIVTEEQGVGAAVLIRAIEPIEGIAHMKQHRGKSIKLHDLTNGPAKCTEAFHIARNENGIDLTGDTIYVLDAPRVSESDIGRSTRIGTTRSPDLHWRFFIQGNPFVSRGKPIR